jgi:hypothetical protein
MDSALEKVVPHGFRDNFQIPSCFLNNLFYFMVLFLKKTVEFLQEYYKMSNQLSDFGTLNKVLYCNSDN